MRPGAGGHGAAYCVPRTHPRGAARREAGPDPGPGPGRRDQAVASTLGAAPGPRIPASLMPVTATVLEVELVTEVGTTRPGRQCDLAEVSVGIVRPRYHISGHETMPDCDRTLRAGLQWVSKPRPGRATGGPRPGSGRHSRSTFASSDLDDPCGARAACERRRLWTISPG